MCRRNGQASGRLKRLCTRVSLPPSSPAMRHRAAFETRVDVSIPCICSVHNVTLTYFPPSLFLFYFFYIFFLIRSYVHPFVE